MGTSTVIDMLPALIEDHPHACGDKLSSAFLSVFFQGSSPRVWGQVNFFRAIMPFFGIIPTRVGTSSAALCLVVHHRDHPHACGDKTEMCLALYPLQGSSPRVWGQVLTLPKGRGQYGIIPTRVGTRLKKSRKIAVLQNQPLRFPLTFHRSFV